MADVFPTKNWAWPITVSEPVTPPDSVKPCLEAIQLRRDRDELLAALEWMLAGEEADSCETFRELVARIRAGK